MGRRRAAALLAAALAAGCSVAPLPQAAALRGQTEHDQEWDAKECRWEAAGRSRYNPDYSPGGNLLAQVFFWGTSGAAVGGMVTGFPLSSAGPATDGLIAGSSAGGLVGGVEGLSGRRRFERAWARCMEGRGYAVAPGQRPAPASPGREAAGPGE